MGILPEKVLQYSLCFHVLLLKMAMSKVLDPDIEMKGKSGAGWLSFDWISIEQLHWILMKSINIFTPEFVLQKMREIKKEILLDETHKDSNCVMIAVICHGNKRGELMDRDLERAWITEDFVADLSLVKPLIGRPKILFVQSCRGGTQIRLFNNHLSQLIYCARENNVLNSCFVINPNWWIGSIVTFDEVFNVVRCDNAYWLERLTQKSEQSKTKTKFLYSECYILIFSGQVGEGRPTGGHLTRSEDVTEPLIIPDKADMFIGFATVPEYV